MHTATQIDLASFVVEKHGTIGDVSWVFPEWHRYDRFGIIITEPYGTLGASLLVQLAIGMYYSADPRRTEEFPQYPEVYLFHVGGRFGDHANFDFYPPRKEVFLPAPTGAELLCAVNDRAITRLAMPDGPLGDAEELYSGVGSWTEQGAAMTRLASCIAYSVDGRVHLPDLTIRTDDVSLAQNTVQTLEPLRTLHEDLSLPEDRLPGPATYADMERFSAIVQNRSTEVEEDVRKALLAAHSPNPDPPILEQTYKSQSKADALSRLVAISHTETAS